MNDKQKYAIGMAINIMDKHFDRHCNTVYSNRETGVNVGYGEAINILLNMLVNDNVHTCNCKYNNIPINNEPCCRCDSGKENREMKIVTVSDLIKILDTEENRYGGATGKPRTLNLSLNGNFAGSVESVKLDGYGDGLITDVTMEITSSKFTATNADRIRNMSDEELVELITDNLGFDCSDYCDRFLPGCAHTCGGADKKIALNWLRTEAE